VKGGWETQKGLRTLKIDKKKGKEGRGGGGKRKDREKEQGASWRRERPPEVCPGKGGTKNASRMKQERMVWTLRLASARNKTLKRGRERGRGREGEVRGMEKKERAHQQNGEQEGDS